MIRRVAGICCLAFLGFMTLSCSDSPLESPVEPQFAKGGNKDKDGGARRDINFGEYEVEWIDPPHSGPGFTSESDVNLAVNNYLLNHPDITHLFFENSNDYANVSSPAEYFGCPEADRRCSKVTLHFTGSAFTLSGGMANMVVGCGLDGVDPPMGCMNDPDLDVRRLASTAGGSTFPSIPWELLDGAIDTDETTGVSSFTYYWQGQRGITHRKVLETKKVRGKIRTTYGYTEVWDFLPDLHTAGTPETPVFSFGARLSASEGATYYTAWTSYRREDNCTENDDDCRGSFQGVPIGDPLYMWIDLWELDNQGRFEFAIQAFTQDPTATNFPKLSDRKLDYTDPAVLAANPDSHSRVMMVTPEGSKVMLNSASSGRRLGGYNYKVGVAETRYVVDLTTEDCYEFHALSLVAREGAWETWQKGFEVNRLVWSPGIPKDNVFHVEYEGQGYSMALGSCSS